MPGRSRGEIFTGVDDNIGWLVKSKLGSISVDKNTKIYGAA